MSPLCALPSRLKSSPPLRLPSRAVPRPWHEKTPETLPLTHPEWHVQTAQSRSTPGCKPLQQAAVACWGSRRRGERAAAAAGGGPEAGGGKMVFGFPIRVALSEKIPNLQLALSEKISSLQSELSDNINHLVTATSNLAESQKLHNDENREVMSALHEEIRSHLLLINEWKKESEERQKPFFVRWWHYFKKNKK
jgi:hypothetical protein